MKGVQCYELFGGIALKNSHIFANYFDVLGHICGMGRKSVSGYTG